MQSNYDWFEQDNIHFIQIVGVLMPFLPENDHTAKA
jgi:hypothetical protein